MKEIKKFNLSDSGIFLPTFRGEVSCGLFGISDDFIEKYQSLDSRFIKNKASTFFLKARGQSMEPTIFPGEYLVVDRSIRPFWGRVCILAFEGQLVCKRVVKSQAGIILRSDNLKFKDIKVYNSKEVNFWGVVTARVGEVL